MTPFDKMDDGFLNTYLLKVVYELAHTLSWSLLPIYLFKSGFSYVEIALYFLIAFGTSFVVSLTLKEHSTRPTLKKSLAMRIAMILLVVVVFAKAEVYLAAVLYGIFMVYFWNAYNIVYFSYSKGSNRGLYSGLFFATGPVMGIILPLIAGVLAEHFGYWVTFLIGIPLFFWAIKRADRFEQMDIKYSLKTAIVKMQGVRTLLIIEGIWQAVPFVIIPIFTLFFINSEVDYGLFLALLSFLGAIASIIAGWISDRMENRSIFIYPIAILLGIFTILSAFSKDALSWIVLIGIVSFFRDMAYPFMTLVVLDRDVNLTHTIHARRVLQGFGNLIGIAFVVVCLHYFGNFYFALIFLGIIGLLYPIVLYRKHLYYGTDLKMEEAIAEKAYGAFGVMGFIYYNILMSWRKEKWVEIKVKPAKQRAKVAIKPAKEAKPQIKKQKAS